MNQIHRLNCDVEAKQQQQPERRSSSTSDVRSMAARIDSVQVFVVFETFQHSLCFQYDAVVNEKRQLVTEMASLQRRLTDMQTENERLTQELTTVTADLSVLRANDVKLRNGLRDAI